MTVFSVLNTKTPSCLQTKVCHLRPQPVKRPLRRHPEWRLGLCLIAAVGHWSAPGGVGAVARTAKQVPQRATGENNTDDR